MIFIDICRYLYKICRLLVLRIYVIVSLIISKSLLSSVKQFADAVWCVYIYIYIYLYIYVCVCVSVCVSVCVFMCVCVFTSIHCEGFICLDQLGYQETDQRRCVKDVGFLCRFPSSLLWNAEPNLSASCFILLVH